MDNSEVDFLARLAVRTAAMNSWCFKRQPSPLAAASPPRGSSQLDSRSGHLPLTGRTTLQTGGGGGGGGGPCSLARSRPLGAKPAHPASYTLSGTCVALPSGARGLACLSLPQMAACLCTRLAPKPRPQNWHLTRPSGSRLEAPGVCGRPSLCGLLATTASAALHLRMWPSRSPCAISCPQYGQSVMLFSCFSRQAFWWNFSEEGKNICPQSSHGTACGGIPPLLVPVAAPAAGCLDTSVEIRPFHLPARAGLRAGRGARP
mmetsp:Transcript_1251/g.3648  ORF Transcript_1251/g.3648 Transcript_1251/m.3648 type:complete len:261 (+) Transcript_1251:882-1664(+)